MSGYFQGAVFVPQGAGFLGPFVVVVVGVISVIPGGPADLQAPPQFILDSFDHPPGSPRAAFAFDTAPAVEGQAANEVAVDVDSIAELEAVAVSGNVAGMARGVSRVGVRVSPERLHVLQALGQGGCGAYPGKA